MHWHPLSGWNCIQCLCKHKMMWCFSSFKGSYRDESAPLFVGTSLALSALAAVCAYGVWRYAIWPNLTHNYPFFNCIFFSSFEIFHSGITKWKNFNMELWSKSMVYPPSFVITSFISSPTLYSNFNFSNGSLRIRKNSHRNLCNSVYKFETQKV